MLILRGGKKTSNKPKPAQTQLWWVDEKTLCHIFRIFYLFSNGKYTVSCGGYSNLLGESTSELFFLSALRFLKRILSPCYCCRQHVQWMYDVYEDVFKFSSLWILILPLKTLCWPETDQTIHLAHYHGLSVPWSVVIESGKVFKKLCMCRMFPLPCKSFWLSAIKLWLLERRVTSLEAFWSLYMLSTDRLIIISLTDLWTCLFFTLTR